MEDSVHLLLGTRFLFLSALLHFVVIVLLCRGDGGQLPPAARPGPGGAAPRPAAHGKLALQSLAACCCISGAALLPGPWPRQRCRCCFYSSSVSSPCATHKHVFVSLVRCRSSIGWPKRSSAHWPPYKLQNSTCRSSSGWTTIATSTGASSTQGAPLSPTGGPDNLCLMVGEHNSWSGQIRPIVNSTSLQLTSPVCWPTHLCLQGHSVPDGAAGAAAVFWRAPCLALAQYCMKSGAAGKVHLEAGTTQGALALWSWRLLLHGCGTQ